MSDDFTHLLLLIGAIYGLELLSFLPEPRRLLVQLVGRRFVLTRSGFAMRNPLPWSLCFAVEGFPLALGQDACAAYQPHRPTTSRPLGWGHRFLRYDAIREVRAIGQELEVNGEVFLKHASEPAARAAAGFLNRVRLTRADLRPAVIDGIMRQMLDCDALASRRDALLRNAVVLRVVSTLLFVHIAAALILFATTDWALPYWSRFLLAFLALVAMVVWQFWASHRTLYPDARGDRWLKAFVLAVNFPSACRGGEALGRDLFAGFHALAVERVVCDATTFRRRAKAELLALGFPPPWAAEPPLVEARALLVEHRQRAATLLTEMLHSAEIDVDALLAPPTPTKPSSFGFCPRCHVEYLAETARCVDCQVAVTPFARR